MVVAHVANNPSQSDVSITASVRRKNRRRLSRKTPRLSAVVAPVQNEDHEMTEGETSHPSITDRLPAQENTGFDDDELMIDTDPTSLLQTTSASAFPPLTANAEKTRVKSETRRIPMPPHRMTPLKKDWVNVYGPLTEILGLQVRMNVQRRCVEIRVCIILTRHWIIVTLFSQTSKETKDIGALQKGADFVKAFALGFDVKVRARDYNYRHSVNSHS